MSKEHPDYITSARLGSGFAAIHMRWYDDVKGYDVQQTGVGRYTTPQSAIEEAKSWAISEEIQYREAKNWANHVVRDDTTRVPMFPAMGSTADLKRDIWNEAIEAAAKVADAANHDGAKNLISRTIRELKKS